MKHIAYYMLVKREEIMPQACAILFLLLVPWIAQRSIFSKYCAIVFASSTVLAHSCTTNCAIKKSHSVQFSKCIKQIYWRIFARPICEGLLFPTMYARTIFSPTINLHIITSEAWFINFPILVDFECSPTIKFLNGL